MRFKTFGRRTGLRVSQYALGTGNFGTGWGAGAEPEEARAIFDRFRDAGGNFIDTADAYQIGESERLLGQFIGSDRDDIVLATKYTVGTSADRRLSRTGNGRKNLRLSVEASLDRLDTDHIDLLWVHYPDELTPVDEILRSLDDLVSQGKILHAAFSNFPAWRTARAAALADAARWEPVAGIQVEYSLVERSADREQFPMAEALGLGVTTWSPLGGGLLTGKYRRSDDGRLTELKTLIHTESSAQKTAVLDAVLEVAEELGRPPAQVAMAWVNERSRRCSAAVVPVIGPRSTAQLAEYLDALEVRLSDEQYARLSAISAPDLGVPHTANAARLDDLQGGRADVVDQPAFPVA